MTSPRTLLAALLAIALVALAGPAAVADGGADAEPAHVNADAVNPAMIAPGLAEAEEYRLSGEARCRPGNLQCVDNLIREMERHDEALGCHHNAVFGLLYLRTTEGIRGAIHDGFFDDGHLLAHQAYAFGRYYLDPYYAWERGQDALVPEAWAIAFDAADEQRVTVVGNMLLGINAHVNRDLPFVLDSLGLVNPDGSSRKPDHDRVNAVLAETRPVAVPEIAAELDPSVLEGGSGDPDLVPDWRERAWQHAELLDAADSESERAEVAAFIEAYAAGIGRAIVDQTAYTPETVDQRAARNEHCADVRG